MKRLLLISFVIFSLTIAAAPARAEQPSQESLLKMLSASGSVKVINTVVAQVIARNLSGLKSRISNLPQDGEKIISDEINQGGKKIANLALAKQMAFYAQNMTQEDVDALNAIYNSPAWKKQLEVTKAYITGEYKQVLQQDIPNMVGDMMKTIISRLENEGYIKKGEAEN